MTRSRILPIVLLLGIAQAACGDPCKRALDEHRRLLSVAAELQPTLAAELPEGVLVHPGPTGLVSQIADACADFGAIEPAAMRELRLSKRSSRDSFCAEIGSHATRYMRAHRRASEVAIAADRACGNSEGSP